MMTSRRSLDSPCFRVATQCTVMRNKMNPTVNHIIVKHAAGIRSTLPDSRSGLTH